MIRRAALALVAVVALVETSGCADRKSEPASATPGQGWAATCQTALREAAQSPARERAAVILAGCPVCGVPWTALGAAERGTVRPADVLAVVDACGGVCKGNARATLADGLAEVARGDAPSLPWRQLARDCPTTVGVDEATARSASATWYALGKVAAKIAAAAQSGTAPATLPAAAIGLVIPLPARSIAGTGFRLTPGEPIDPRLARLHVTVTSTETSVGALPLATLGKAGLELMPLPGAAYPGEPVALDKMSARLDALGHELAPGVGDLDGPLVIAPLGLPASRVLEVLRAAGERRLYLATIPPPRGGLGWTDVPAALSPAFGGRVPGRALAIRLGQGGAIGVSGGWGGLAAATALPAGNGPETLRAAAAIADLAAPGEVVAIDATADVTVEDLTQLVAALAFRKINALVAAPALRWPAQLPPFDAAAVRAAHAAPAPSAPSAPSGPPVK